MNLHYLHFIPFAEMKVGQSFHVPDLGMRNNVQSSVSYYSRKNDVKFSLRIDRERGGFHVIRIA